MISTPYLLRRLAELNIIDAARDQALARDGILTLADLELAIAEERRSVDGAALRDAAHLLHQERRPITLGRAWDILDPLIAAIARCPHVDAVEPAAAVRRAAPLLHSLALTGRAANPARAIDSIVSLPPIAEVLHRTAARALVLSEGHEVDIRIAPAEEYGSLQFAATGPPAHVAAVRRTCGPRPSAAESDVYAAAGLAYLPPELRDSPDALDAARHGRMPRLVERADVRGDLHMHSTYSDGKDSVRRMLEASQALGHEYVAITDHSEHAGAARTVTPAQIERQRDEIARLRGEFPRMDILHGLEVDILPDGRLDCPDAVLASLDIVLASLHDPAGDDPARLTRRCVGAIRHPLVSIITHPSNQLVGRREGYDMDYDEIYAAAAETGTALEIDGAPTHLDLSGERAREAVRAGVTVAIDSDCHRARWLERQMRFGIGTARRGWVEPAHVLNARSVSEVRAFLARKRGR
ncbi:MAG TPA: DNA polymerase/3'-5' exonuclease PolX [Vicinamibacterales bacterium]|nr:DNA polymerase/3'-5' exonuclease PolX [Vicinamibacterales bacterium]